jgi:hypothetical protein
MVINLLATYDDDTFTAQIEYVFRLLLSSCGVDYQIVPLRRLKRGDFNPGKTLIISYGKKKPDLDTQPQIHIYASDFFGRQDYLRPSSMPKRPLKRYQGTPVIYLGHGKLDDFVRQSHDTIETNFDIIASSFFMVSRYEEVVINVRDQYGRFPAVASLAYKERFLDKAVVNEYIEWLWNWISNLNSGLKRKKLWGSGDLAVCLTHDVDEITRYKFYPPLIAIKNSLREKDIKKAWGIYIDFLKTRAGLKRDPYHDAFDYIINLEQGYGFISSFYFMANNERYSLESPCSKEMILKLKNLGFEVGIHPGIDSYDNPDVLKSERGGLEKIAGSKVIGGRQHYLKWKAPQSWRTWEAAGLIYDSTLGFADHEGFRCGICHPFHPFDLTENRVIDLWEIPLTVMDSTLAGSRGLSAQEGQDILANLLSTVERFNGVFVLLWHNSYMCNLLTPSWKKCFESFYRTISSKNALVSSASDILETYQSHCGFLRTGDGQV